MDRRAMGRQDLSAVELAYLAGIIDGEGTIGIYKGGGPYSYYLRLIVSNSSFPLMEWVHARIGGSFVPHGKPEKRQHRQMWEVVLVQRRAATVVRACLPYLVVKDRQARVGLEFVDNFVNFRGTRIPPPEAELWRRVRLYEESLRLNGGFRRGRPRKINEQRFAPPRASTLSPVTERR